VGIQVGVYLGRYGMAEKIPIDLRILVGIVFDPQGKTTYSSLR